MVQRSLERGKRKDDRRIAHRSSVIHGLGEDLRGPAAFKSFHAAYRDAFPDVKIQDRADGCGGRSRGRALERVRNTRR
jgi:hypothetical protein